MEIPARKLLIICAIVISCCLIYTWRLNDAPIYLSPDEAITAVDAHSLAMTGRDLQGHWFPLYLQIQMPGEKPMGWSTPAIMYLSALAMRIFPFSEWSARLPTALVGIADIVLVYFLARRLFRNDYLAAVAAALLAITPAHFIMSRYALDYEYPLPFILGWLLALDLFIETGKSWHLVVAVTCLGLGFYSYNAAVFLTPLYFCFTILILSHEKKPRHLYGLAALAFMLPLSALFVWVLATKHPTIFVEAVQHYSLYDTEHLNVLQGIGSFFSFNNISDRASLFWSFFSPSFLFLSGSQQMMFSTGATGVFLLPVAVLLPLGIYAVVSRRPTPMNMLVVGGFLTGPLAATLVPEGGTIIRAMAMVPFGVLLATFGLEFLWSAAVSGRPAALMSSAGIALLALGATNGLYVLVSHHRISSSAVALVLIGASGLAFYQASPRLRQGPVIVGCLVAAMLIQIGYFWVDYFGDYRARSAHWLSGNLRGAVEALIELDGRERAPQVYFTVLRSEGGLGDIRNRWIDPFWRFYLIKHKREDLLDRTTLAFELANAHKVPDGSLLLAYVGDRTAKQMIHAGELRVVRLIPEVERPPFFVILRR